MRRFSLSASARADIRAIWKHIAQSNEAAANRLRGRLEDVFRLLGKNPLLGQACDELCAGLRFFCVENYVVFYEATNRGSRIVRVLHGAQDIQSMF
jgi:toxin ParE1/3/4